MSSFTRKKSPSAPLPSSTPRQLPGYNLVMVSVALTVVFYLLSAVNSWADFHAINVPEESGGAVFHVDRSAGADAARGRRLRTRMPRRTGDSPLPRPGLQGPSISAPVPPQEAPPENESSSSVTHEALLDVGLRNMGLRSGERNMRRAAQGMASRLNGLLQSSEARRVLNDFSDVEVEASRLYSGTGEIQLRFTGADEARVNAAVDAVSRWLRRSRDVSFAGEAGVLGVQ